ncbi:hypothetical protein DL93DRAFT_2169309 [Clavulina sp. PMI_390]|nr:hypothetical protein DL93DRAFT_2169309 [Clavulina sp. PMI_390]
MKKSLLDAMKAAIKVHNEVHTNTASKPLLSLREFYKNTSFIPPFPVETHADLYDRNLLLSINEPHLIQIQDDVEASPSPSVNPLVSPAITNASVPSGSGSTSSDSVRSLEDSIGALPFTPINGALDISTSRTHNFGPEIYVEDLGSQYWGTDVQVGVAHAAPLPTFDAENLKGSLSVTSEMLGYYSKSLSIAQAPAAFRSTSMSFEDQHSSTIQPPSSVIYDQDNQFSFRPFIPQVQMQASLTVPNASFVQNHPAYPPPVPALPQPTPPNDPPVQAEATTDPTTAFSQVLEVWDDVVSPFSHRHQTQLNPRDIANFVRGGGDSCVLQAAYSASNLCTLAYSRFQNLPLEAVQDVIGYQDGVTKHIQDFLSTRPADASVFVSAVLGALPSTTGSMLQGVNGTVTPGVDFSLLLGGKAGWRGQLDIACKWIFIHWDSVANGSFGPSAVALVGIVVWYDILGALAQRQYPTLEKLLGRILASNSPVQMPAVMGCENHVMLALAKTAKLADRVRVSGSQLPVRQVMVLAQEIKNVFTPPDLPVPAAFHGVPSSSSPTDSFANASHPGAAYEQDTPPMIPSSLFPPSASTTFSEFSDAAHSPLFDPMHIPDPIPRWSAHVHSTKNVTHAFCMAGNVHLQAILLEYSHIVDTPPYQPLASVMNLEHAADWAARVLKCIPANDADRSIVWPLCVIGSVVQDHTDRAWFADRFAAIEGRELLGNVLNAESLMHSVWSRQDRAQRDALKSGQPVGRVDEPDWIDCMDGRPLLLA